MLKLAKKLFVILILLIFTMSMVAATAYAVSTPTEKKIVEYKEKKVNSYKISWNCNGGKIGSKKTVTTTVKKGSKIGKLATTPKRSKYSFKGWYTKKSGGTKITKNTKPKKSVTYYAKWAKKTSTIKSRVLNSEEKKLVGAWVLYFDNSGLEVYKDDGTYWHYSDNRMFKTEWHFQGYYSVKNGVLTQQYQCRKNYGSGWGPWGAWETSKSDIKIYTEDGKQYMDHGNKYIRYEESDLKKFTDNL